MSKRNKEWARKSRAALIAELGGKCTWCDSPENLTFDCIQPCGDAHHRFDTSQRMCFYRYRNITSKEIFKSCAADVIAENQTSSTHLSA